MIKKISITELKPGMTVARMKSDIWCHCPHLYTKEGVVTSPEEVRAIVDEGYLEVFIDTSATEEESSHDFPSTGMDGGSVVPIAEELVRARKVYAQAVLVARELFVAASKGKPMDMAAAGKTVDDLHASLERNPAALSCLTQLADSDAYLYSHSVNVAVIGMFTAQGWGFDREGIRHMGLAGLFHDLGKTRLPLGLLNRRVKLTAEESRVMEGHCVHGLAILETQREVPRAIKRAVVEHHERFDGKGYPFGLKYDQISRLGRLLSLSDCFDALTSKRTYKEAMPPSKALSIMYGMRDKDFAAEEVDSFIKILGVYPSGSLVQLGSGEVGVVSGVDPALPLLPMVTVVLDKDLNPTTPVLKNLADLQEPEAGGRVTRYLDADILECDPLELMLT